MSLQYRKIGIIGAGYVGMTTNVMLPYFINHDINYPSYELDITVYDIDVEKIDRLQDHPWLPFDEPHLLDRYKIIKSPKYVKEITDIIDNDVLFICLPTPSSPSGETDMTFIKKFMDDLSQHQPDPNFKIHTIVMKSTVPIGTGTSLCQYYPFLENIHYIHYPEFLAEGTACYDFLHPRHRIIGSNKSLTVYDINPMKHRFYRLLIGDTLGDSSNIIVTDISTAETIKYFINSFLAVKITYTNELNMMSSLLGTSWDDISTALHNDSRLGDSFMTPSPGYGGSCFPKDVTSLTSQMNKLLAQRFHLPLLDTIKDNTILSHVDTSNHRCREIICSTILDDIIKLTYDSSIEKVIIDVYGVSFKLGTSDIRKSFIIDMMDYLAHNYKRKFPIHIRFYDGNPTALGELEKISSWWSKSYITFSFESGLEISEIYHHPTKDGISSEIFPDIIICHNLSEDDISYVEHVVNIINDNTSILYDLRSYLGHMTAYLSNTIYKSINNIF